MLPIHRKPTSWDLYFIEMATLVSSKSKDTSTKVGAVIVGSGNEILTTGFNGFPRGIDEESLERWERPEKYDWIVHAEANAIANAARIGVPLLGSTLYMNFMPTPCSRCTGLLIQAGIRKIIGPDITFSGVGAGTFYDVDIISETMLNEISMERYIIDKE